MNYVGRPTHVGFSEGAVAVVALNSVVWVEWVTTEFDWSPTFRTIESTWHFELLLRTVNKSLPK